MARWPVWWNWEIELTPHLFKRMLDRGFSEVELRRMIDDATGVRPSATANRWIISTRSEGREWEVVAEPLPDEHILLIVTAYPIG